MVKRGRRSPVDPAQSAPYLRVARALCKSAEDLAAIAQDSDTYGNAIAITAIHGCIAYADALCIRFGAFKSAEGDHLRAVDALQEAMGARLPVEIVRIVRRILAQKDAVSYQADFYTVLEARAVVRDLAQLADFAEERLSSG